MKIAELEMGCSTLQWGYDPYADRAFELGANSFFVKPPDAGTLLALVQRLHAGWKIVPGKELLDSVV
jgi:hypothetical protein